MATNRTGLGVSGMNVLRDARRTLVPDLGSRHGPLPPLLVALTVVTGIVDAFSYLLLGHVFVANMTGNVVFVAFALLGAPGFSIAASVVALAAFAAGAGVGGRIAHRESAHRGRLLLGATTMEAALVVVALVVAVAADRPYDAAARYSMIVLLGIALGAQNAAVRALAVPDLTTTVLTMTITGMSADSQAAGGADGKLGRRALSMLAMFLGALVGAAIALHGAAALTLLPAAVLLPATAAATQMYARRGGGWITPA
jgi:uncharacterized membrane protein YoaK (UPF0700 family)